MSQGTRTGGRAATHSVIPGRTALSVGRPDLPEPDGYRWRALSDLARLESGHTPSRTRDDYWGGDTPWIGIRDATGNHGRVISRTMTSVTQAGLDNSSARLLPEGTVCLSRTASVGFVVQMGRPMATSQDFVNWVCGPELDPNYLRHVLMVEQDSIRNRFAHGSTHQTMYYPEAKALHVLVPSTKQQQRVVSLLGAFEDKTSANDRLVTSGIRYAEAFARSRFHAETALADVAELTMGSSPPGESYNEEGVGVVFHQGVRDFGVRSPRRRVWTTEPLRIADRGDTLVSVRAPVGSLNLASEKMCLGRGLAGARSRRRRPMTLFHQLAAAGASWAPYEAEGTVFGSIGRQQLEAVPVPAVDEILADSTEAGLEVAELRIAAALGENDVLAKTRDELLPSLMSGKIEIEDAEKAVGDVL